MLPVSPGFLLHSWHSFSFCYPVSWYCQLPYNFIKILPRAGLFHCLYLINTDKVNGAVVNDEALSIPDISGVHRTLFLKSYDFMGMLQSRMLDVIVHIGYLPDRSPLVALGVVLQSQNSASDSSGKLSSQHVLHCSGPLATLSISIEKQLNQACDGHHSTACAVQSHCACKTLVLTLFFNALWDRTPCSRSEVVCVGLTVVQLHCTFAFGLRGSFFAGGP